MLILNSSFSSLGDCNDCTMIILFHNYSEIYIVSFYKILRINCSNNSS